MRESSLDSYGFSAEMVKSLRKMGYETLTEVQERVIPAALAGQDIIVSSATGSGKTAAFAIPLCEKIDLGWRSPQALVLTPTRELAVQVKQDISNIGRFKRIRCAAIFGKQPMETQKNELRQRVHVVVGTPGRTFDHIEKGNLDLSEIRYLVLDEADKMLDMGFIEQVGAIIRLLPRERVTLVFSATLPESVQEICNQYMRNPMRIAVESVKPASAMIRQGYYLIREFEKNALLRKILYTMRPDRCLLFCNTRERVESVFAEFKSEGKRWASLHGGMEQRERLNTMQSFKLGGFQFLVATDVAARGIHVDDISLVINYDLSLEPENYVHRIGRTGRAGNAGAAITFVPPEERRRLVELEEYLGYRISRCEPPTDVEVENGQLIFAADSAMPAFPVDRSEIMNREITRIRINAGRKVKMRPGDIVGAVTAIEGITAADIGIIDIQDTCSYVEILSNKGGLVLAALLHANIKGKVYTVRQVGFRDKIY
ncbi:MAG TPA: DEAD/DEAH box helicase [Negativicutes bacterium]|nr:DEAD/DEAH box helicase [Negativicutes bacterium]